VDVGGKQVPTLKNGGKPLNLDFSAPDRFTPRPAATPPSSWPAATTSSASPPRSRRKTATAPSAPSSTTPARPTPQLRAGKPYVGLVTLFGKQFITDYEPVRDASGKVVGVLYVGIDITPTWPC
jgi:methyl-accepting chemotaxis protein